MSDVLDRINGSLSVTTPEEAASEIKSDATLVISGFGSVGYPKALPKALASCDRDLDLTIISGGSVGDEIDTELVEANAISRRFPYQARTASRDAINQGTIAYHDRHVSKTADEVELGYLGGADIAVIEAVAAGPDWLIPSTSIGHTPGFVRAADKLLIEVNESHPLGLQQLHDVYRPALPPKRKPIPLTSPDGRIGSPKVKFDPEKLVAIVRTNQRDSPYKFRDPSDVDEAIASNLATFLQTECKQNPTLTDRIVLQFGVGSLGNALMAAFNSVDFGNRTVSYFGEVIQDGLLDMLDAGNLESASAASLALSAEGQERLYNKIDKYAEDIILRNADISNNPGLIERFGVVGVNSALEVDVYGHVNSTHLNGSKLMNGLGGSGDFSRNSMLGVIVLGSTAGSGDISRIVPMVSHVDHTEHDIDVVVTEQGVADLRGLSPLERANVMVDNCAHPDFRDNLTDYLETARTSDGHISHSLNRVFDWQ